MTRGMRARGFTLVELMIVVCTIGLLASVALPSYRKMSLRSRTAERTVVMKTIERGVMEVIGDTGRLPGNVGYLNSAWNPPLPPSTSKRPYQPNLAVWPTFFGRQAITEGGLYYSYHIEASDGGAGWATLWLDCRGDLDGDGSQSFVYNTYTRSPATKGMFRFSSRFPLIWDQTSF